MQSEIVFAISLRENIAPKWCELIQNIFFRCIVYSKLNSEKISACIWYCWISSEYSVGAPHRIFVTIRSMLWWLSASWHAHTGGRTSWISYHCHQGCWMHPRLPGIRDAGIMDESSTSGFIIVIYADRIISSEYHIIVIRDGSPQNYLGWGLLLTSLANFASWIRIKWGQMA